MHEGSLIVIRGQNKRASDQSDGCEKRKRKKAEAFVVVTASARTDAAVAAGEDERCGAVAAPIVSEGV